MSILPDKPLKKSAWYESRFTGLFRASGDTPTLAHDPDIAVWSGSPAFPNIGENPGVGGASWIHSQAQIAGLGEAIERMATSALVSDGIVRASFNGWSLAEPAVEPGVWVLFHPRQYAGMPFEPLTRDTECDWVRCRAVRSGEPFWVPGELIFMDFARGEAPRFCPGISTGWSAHRTPQQAMLSGLRELLERDATINAWWGHYPIFEVQDVELGVPRDRYERANLSYRFFRIDSPFTGTATMVTVEGEDQKGRLFAIGSACGVTLRESWEKSLCEAIQDRLYVRHLFNQPPFEGFPTSFAEHALYYTLNPDQLKRTVLANVTPAPCVNLEKKETLDDIVASLPHVPLFRIATPLSIAQSLPDWVVVRVLAPGLQPLHGSHYFPFLGGAAWKNRTIEDYRTTPPHPFA